MAKQECGGNGLCVNNGHSTIDVWNVFWSITNQSTMLIEKGGVNGWKECGVDWMWCTVCLTW